MSSEGGNRRVFLSHKGADKPRVRKFFNVLNGLGYGPWLDEDAMVAGTPLDRGILRGMEESCGAVFFITAAFKDERYLADEIDHALGQKREKGDKFALVTLVLEPAECEIPKLLRRYVWKEPDGDLDALHEIVRALPLVPAAPDWRPELGGGTQGGRNASPIEELDTAALQILKTAADSNGRIELGNFLDGHVLQAGSHQFKPESEREWADWLAAVESLVQCGLLSPKGTGGESFALMKAGYDYADTLPPAEKIAEEKDRF